MPSFIVGFLILAALEVVTSSDAAAGRAALIPTAVAGAVRRLLDPDLALIPNWHDDTAPLTSAATPAAAAAQSTNPFDAHIGDFVQATTGATPVPTKPRRP